MRSYSMWYSGAIMTAFVYLSSFSYANEESLEEFVRITDSYEIMDDEVAELRKDVFLDNQIFAEIVSFNDPITFLTATSVCKDWQAFCHNSLLRKKYIDESFQKIKTRLNSPELFAEKLAQLFVEMEVAKIIEYHRPNFPYSENVQIATSAIILQSSMFSGIRRNLFQRAPQQQQAPRAREINFANQQPMTLMNLLPDISLTNLTNQANDVNQANQANQEQRESYLRNLENQFDSVINELNDRPAQVQGILALLVHVDLFEDDDQIANPGGLINNNVIARQNQDRQNERNLNGAQESFRNLCDRIIPTKIRELSDENFDLLASHRGIHSIIFHSMLDEIRNSNEFQNYVDQKIISYRSTYERIDEINPTIKIATLTSIELTDAENQNNYLTKLKQIFDKILTGE
ncbi:MAG: hypothetical protein AB8G05_01120 [Oligoflexales bacterium]